MIVAFLFVTKGQAKCVEVVVYYIPQTRRDALYRKDCLSHPQETASAAVGVSWPLSTSHNRTVPSSLPLARVVPSGENDTDKTQPVWPVSRATSAPVWASYSEIPTPVATASRVPSGE